jgi:hypothetical protein
MSTLENGSLAKWKAAGSTSFPNMPIRSMALSKPTAKADPFISFHRLILVESLRKPKQTPPKCFGASILEERFSEKFKHPRKVRNMMARKI